MLSATEQSLLRWILPAHRPAYAALLRRLEGMSCAGNPLDEELIFSDGATPDDRDGTLEPVSAIGVLRFPSKRVTMTVHDENEGSITLRICPRVPDNGAAETARWSLSYWSPGDPGPERGSEVRCIEIQASPYVFALCPAEQRLWLHDTSSEFNRLLPMTAVYNHLMRNCGIRDPERILAPERLFSDHALFSDIDIIHALLRYGAHSGRFTIPEAAVADREKNTIFQRLLNSFKRHG
ncbi:MAG: hypothetical protein M5R41_08625 [Bacteroidia bacterium]|nr:hypothetical protein [Bacteroidia bacterium]